MSIVAHFIADRPHQFHPIGVRIIFKVFFHIAILEVRENETGCRWPA
jgi:hypothetical protein